MTFISTRVYSVKPAALLSFQELYTIDFTSLSVMLMTHGRFQEFFGSTGDDF